MLFINLALLGGLAAVAIPILIHILNRRSSRIVDWGAIQFLMDSIATRTRKIQLEEALLMAIRCLLVALVALAVARPFIPPGSSIPWMVVLPLGLFAIAGIGASFVLWQTPKWRWLLFGVSLFLILLCSAAIYWERQLNLKKLGDLGKQDIAIIIDTSASMTIPVDGRTNFDRALDEAKEVIKKSGRGTAYTIIAAGPASSALTQDPTTDRTELLELLSKLKPSDGTMNAHDAFMLATVSLSRGFNPSKQILVLTDGQNVGWDTEIPSIWSNVKRSFERLDMEPAVLLRKFDLPQSLGNATVSAIDFSREVIGVDREVTIRITVENTGTEAVAPKGLSLKIGDKELDDLPLGQLLPGAKETIEVMHRFGEPGSYAVEANLQVNDQLMRDNRLAKAVNIVENLRVLIVDGNPAKRYLERASAFLSVALAPASQTGAPGNKSRDFLVVPVVIDATKVDSLSSFDDYHAIILADVPRLPARIATGIADFVSGGGGLLIAPGSRARKEFYNGWMASENEPLLPGLLEEQRLAGSATGGDVSPAISTFNHRALSTVSDKRTSDLGTATLNRYWKLTESTGERGVQVGARLNTSEPMLMSRKVGDGICLLTAMALDARDSNLPLRQSFIPFVHELTYFLCNPGGMNLNIEPSRRLALRLPGERSGAMGGRGLRAEYFRGRDFRDAAIARIDPGINFNWGSGRPDPKVHHDNFSVRWSGVIRPRYSEEYTIEGQCDDFLRVLINDEPVFESGRGTPSGQIRLQADRSYKIVVEFIEEQGDAIAQVYWRSASQNREIIPQERLSPGQSNTLFNRLAGKKYEVTDPSGDVRYGEVVAGDRGGFVRVRGPVLTGLYQVHVPKEDAAAFQPLLTKDSTIPFTVNRDPGESRLQALEEIEMAVLQRHLKLWEPTSAKDSLRILSGQSFGEELWRYLALAALVLLIAEIALARWIAKRRKTSEDESVDFEISGNPGKAFQKQMKKMRESETVGSLN